ncbi:hypothetical protein OH492_18995 [Vibrio chagasii]|nr:hypothetical protein [Vibrio chagasii]
MDNGVIITTTSAGIISPCHLIDSAGTDVWAVDLLAYRSLYH